MLPSGLNIETFIPYVRSHVALANHSDQLETVLSWPPKKARITSDSERLAELLNFPDALQPSDIDNYSHLLHVFLSLRGTGKIPVPDGDLTLRSVNELYDRSVELFSLALQSRQETTFLHPDFRYLEEDLRSKGLHYDVDWNAFLLCARTVHQDSTIRRLPEDEIMPRAQAVFDFYNSGLPNLIMGQAPKWRELNGLNFIPRDLRRSTSSTYDVESYCASLPQIVTPGQILQSKFEAVAWSQRALFRDTPTANLLALNSTLGVPTVAEVVEHLKVLALKVAPEHPRNRSLLHQLRSTYDWLQNNKEAAKVYLRVSDALFLNVDDPESDPWEWRPAGQLLFNAQWDYPETGCFKARGFLQPYRSLLLAAGAKEISDVAFERKERVDPDKLRTAFNAMRSQGQFTDVLLMPVRVSEGEKIDESELWAHSAFLVAAIPHVREARDGWKEGTSAQHPFPGSYFGARAVLDFIYTGKIHQEPNEGDDGHMTFLCDLRELLEVADEWDMADLKDEIGGLVEFWKLLLPDTYREILADAEKYRATSLEKYCREWASKNLDLLTMEVEEDAEDEV
ncbi:hypothetical protein FB45DRAFT_520874 [Roridomyces roridus]|uniref:BTB domain-containing protein n=1 Tax=Roridomyces roridus TaxID=1738132 RepID=A0AAD7BX85_9AGAR|nr:hypothetical protein FB45DRAFT_520874 [Roridomyces roridus]